MSKLSRNTERAISLITVDKSDPLLYWPSYLRTGNRVTPDGVVTSNPPTEKEQVQRIVEADPLGFLLALMMGQPVPVLHINKDHDSDDYGPGANAPAEPKWIVKSETANLGMRRDIAQHLLTKIIPQISRVRKAPQKGDKASMFDKVMEHIGERAQPAEKND